MTDGCYATIGPISPAGVPPGPGPLGPAPGPPLLHPPSHSIFGPSVAVAVAVAPSIAPATASTSTTTMATMATTAAPASAPAPAPATAPPAPPAPPSSSYSASSGPCSSVSAAAAPGSCSTDRNNIKFCNTTSVISSPRCNTASSSCSSSPRSSLSSTSSLSLSLPLSSSSSSLSSFSPCSSVSPDDPPPHLPSTLLRSPFSPPIHYHHSPSPLASSTPLPPDCTDVDMDADMSHSAILLNHSHGARCLWAGCHAHLATVVDLWTHLIELHVPVQNSVPILCEWDSCWTQHMHSEQLLWHLRLNHHLVPSSVPQQPSLFMEMNYSPPVSSPLHFPAHSSAPMRLPVPTPASLPPMGSPTSNGAISAGLGQPGPSFWDTTSSEPLQYIIKQEESYSLTLDQERMLRQEQHHPCLWQGCRLSFPNFETLTSHLSEEHIGMGKSEYICEWANCDRQGRGFGQRQKAMRHIQTHTGDKPFQCQVCQKRFSEANIMAQHMRTHTGEKPFKCTEPGCGRQFSISGALTIHRRVHTGEKPFKCKFDGCDKWFAESSNLTKHLRVHTGERPFQCPYVGCDKRFSRPDQVTRHKKTHLTDNERMAMMKAERGLHSR
ncbi:hypothetical protein BC939DRAFT_464517 [Gamsiella multidivaricata]|uniref:uncharacterized protein n=1 Tax=Gamsiella multidivaricata TaxID=101098 RepID=UPI00221F08F7|nr:uncharacterized protein BC939DRAFT_464517 [Gamsiella multidivaricata]KAI7817931.1 hypothetical protein BC939DRAFT_464517 [Gamsiella multidivaricata]